MGSTPTRERLKRTRIMPNPNDNERRGKGRWQGFDLGGGSGQGGRNPWRFSLVYILGAIVLLFLVQSLFGQSTTKARLDQFYRQLDRHTVQSVTITGASIAWTDTNGSRFAAELPPNFDTSTLVTQLSKEGVQFKGQQPSALTSFLLQWILPFLLLGLLWVFLFRRMAGGGAATALNLGKNRVKIYDRKEMKTTFADVAGVDEAVEELKEIVEFLRTPKKYQRLGGRIPKGVLLLGPPGCGKTLLARAVAGEAAVPFFYMSGSEFVEMFVGLGAARVRELFQQAKEKAPCLVFLDELDTIGKSRAGALGGSLGSHDEREQTLNQLLVEMDGFDTSKGVVIDPEVDLRTLAARTPGFTGADLANVVNEGALLAARREKNWVGMEELEEAIDRVVAGLERKSRVMSERDKVRVAVHEMGHALVALRSRNIDPVHRVTIVPRGVAALGITMVRPLEDRYLMTEPELRDRLVFAMGGRAAEEITFGEISTGAQNDLQNATDIARAMVVEYGMSPKLGPLSFGSDGFRSAGGRPLFPGERPEFSEQTARMIDEEVARLLREAQDQAKEILENDKENLRKLSDVLIEREVIEGGELRKYLDGDKPIPTKEELKQETEKKQAEEAKDRADKVPAGPEIILSRAKNSAAPTQEIPVRPDA